MNKPHQLRTFLQVSYLIPLVALLGACHVGKQLPPTVSSAPPQPKQESGAKYFSGLRISPDGSKVLSVDYQSASSKVAVRSTDSSSQPLVSGVDVCAQSSCSIQSVAWSHDSQQYAFITTKDTTSYVYVETANSTTVGEPIATVAGYASSLQWSPDNKKLSLLAVMHPHKAPGATQAGAPQVGLIEQGPVDEQQLGIISLDTHALELKSPDKEYVYEYSWLPDNKGVVVSSVPGDGDANWWVAKLNYVDITTGKLSLIAKPQQQLRFPTVSPDGKTVAFIGGVMSDYIAPGGDVFTVPVSGGVPVNITPNSQVSYTNLAWHQGGLTAKVQSGLQQSLAVISPRVSGPAGVSTLWDAGASEGEFSADDALNQFASARVSFSTPQEIYVAGKSGNKALTNDNEGLKTNVTASEVNWSNDEFSLDGWLLAPAKVSPGKHPLIVDVHGGPASYQSAYYIPSDSTSLLARLIDKGYYVFLPNPRGSYGHGEAFTLANHADFGGGDFRDILTGIDQAEKQSPIDDAKLAITGVSYGGFMSMWASATSNRFHAVIAGAGVSDWVSYYGENGISQSLIPLQGVSAYDNPAQYMRQSPLNYVKTAVTPTFIWVGQYDIECPPGQSLEFFHALKYRKVPTELYVYPGEGHGLRNSDNIKDETERSIAWLDKYIG